LSRFLTLNVARPLPAIEVIASHSDP